MLKGSGVAVSLGQTEIDTVDKVSVSSSTVRHKVSGLDVTMNQVAGVHKFNTLEHLIGDHKDGLERESAAALVELILEGGTKEIHNHEVVGILGTKVVNLSETGGILQFTVDLVLVSKLRTSRTVLFELDGDLLAIGADSEVNVSKGSSTNAFGNSVFL